MLKTLMVLILSLFLAQTTFSQASNGPTNSVVTKPDDSSETKHLIADPLVRVLVLHTDDLPQKAQEWQ